MTPAQVDPMEEALRMAHETLRMALTPPRRPLAPWVLSAFLAGAGFWMLFGAAITKAMKP